jgi:dihydropteroate synthase
MMPSQRKALTAKFNKKIMLMGILNVTPDSFSDGGQFVDDSTIIEHVNQMVHDGADIIDIGGQSTRPFSKPVSEQEELDRVVPAIKAIRQHLTIPISIDTTKAEIARQAIDAGANIVNDISALLFDPKMAEVVISQRVPVIIMHMQGTPQDMQNAPKYDNVISESLAFFKDRISCLTKQGIEKSMITIDPGIGFGKTVAHNLSIIKHLREYNRLGCPVLVGHSRKSFIETIVHDSVENRDEATAIISAILVMHGVSIIRVHNVSLNNKAIKMTKAIMNAI